MDKLHKVIAYFSLVFNLVLFWTWIYVYNNHIQHAESVEHYEALLPFADSLVVILLQVALSILSIIYFVRQTGFWSKALLVIQAFLTFLNIFQYM